MKISIPKSQAKVVNDVEMIALQVEAASKIFHSYITKQTHEESRQKANVTIFDAECFHCDNQVYKFMSLFMTCFDVGTEIIVAALIYVERVLKKNSDLIITESNAKGLLHSSLTLAAKFFNDQFEKNTIFYAIGGLSKQSMRIMLDLYLDLIQFDLNINEEEFNGVMSKLKLMIARKFAKAGQIVILEKSIKKKLQQTSIIPSTRHQSNYILEPQEAKGNRTSTHRQNRLSSDHAHNFDSSSTVSSSTNFGSMDSDTKSDNGSFISTDSNSGLDINNKKIIVAHNPTTHFEIIQQQPKKKSVCSIF